MQIISEVFRNFADIILLSAFLALYKLIFYLCITKSGGVHFVLATDRLQLILHSEAAEVSQILAENFMWFEIVHIYTIT